MYVIKLIQLAATQLNIDKFVVFYDATAHEEDNVYIGGILELTEDAGKAKRFNDLAEAIKYWQQDPGCSCHRIRMDGAANRPLTAFTAEFQQYAVINKMPPQSEPGPDLELERIRS